MFAVGSYMVAFELFGEGVRVLGDTSQEQMSRQNRAKGGAQSGRVGERGRGAISSPASSPSYA